MPFKSQAQARKFAELLKTGKVSQQTFDEFARASKPLAELPERIGKPAAKRKPSRRRS